MRHNLYLLLCLPFCVFSVATEPEKPAGGIEKVSPVEDLMREHGVLDRLLLIYEEIERRIDTNQPFSASLLKQPAQLMQSFIENYHERLEEEYVIPKLQQAKLMTDLTQTILEQHQRGRLLTDEVLARISEENLKDPVQKKRIRELLYLFVRMYRPHAAREDTVVFPAFKRLVSEEEYDHLGELFEEKEDTLFGERGFFRVVDAVAKLEKELGIYNLAEFTPPKR
jgi:hemerythrin-like domain-containing protein